MRGRSFTCGFPFVGEEVFESLGGMSGYPVEDIAQVGKGIDIDTLARGDETGQDGGGSAAGVTSEEHPVFPANRDPAK